MGCLECGGPIEADLMAAGSEHCLACAAKLWEPGSAESGDINVVCNLPRPSGMTDEQALAHVALRPEVLGAVTACMYSNKAFKGLQATELVDELKRLQDTVLQSDRLEGCEELLITQAHILNLVFNHALRGASQQKTLKGMGMYHRMGMRAQAQCRRTIEALATIRNPAPNILRQTNIANGPQQINNGVITDEQLKLSAKRRNTPLAAVEVLNRATVSTGQTQGGPERAKARPIHKESAS